MNWLRRNGRERYGGCYRSHRFVATTASFGVGWIRQTSGAARIVLRCRRPERLTEEASFHMSEQNISSTMQENRLFPPPPAFAAKAHIKTREEYDRMYRESIDDPEAFWGRAAEPLHWFKRWDRVLDWKAPFARWFVGGKTNVGDNCL